MATTRAKTAPDISTEVTAEERALKETELEASELRWNQADLVSNLVPKGNKGIWALAARQNMDPADLRKVRRLAQAYGPDERVYEVSGVPVPARYYEGTLSAGEYRHPIMKRFVEASAGEDEVLPSSMALLGRVSREVCPRPRRKSAEKLLASSALRYVTKELNGREIDLADVAEVVTALTLALKVAKSTLKEAKSLQAKAK